jgi:hypothetical protein
MVGPAVTANDGGKAPFPWFGGKRRAAPIVWQLLGDVPHYVEPFAGSLAVLLARPHPCNRSYYSETVNDLDGFIVNAWRAIQWHPEEVARHASWPVSEADKQARQIACLKWRTDVTLDLLAGSAEWCDTRVAGWWLYGVACQIGAVAGDGPWTVDDVTGRIFKQGRTTREPGVSRNLPHLTNNGRGVNNQQLREPGVKRARPHLNNGRGVNNQQLREPGVKRDLPHLGDNGRGVNHAGLREPGVSRDLPVLSDDGRGVNHAGLREPGVKRDLPHLVSGGQGVNKPQLREPGVKRDLPHLGNDGQGVNKPQLREPGVMSDDPDNPFHQMTMPGLIRWMQALSARLRHVRIVNGDWTRVVTTGAAHTIPVRMGDGPAGIFLDPPYDSAIRSKGLYAASADDGSVAAQCREWALKVGGDPRWRIVLAGYDVEHAELEQHGWTVHEWFTEGFLTGGMGNVDTSEDGGHQQHRERLWASPHCLLLDTPAQQGSLW